MCCFHYSFQFTWAPNAALRLLDRLQFPRQCQPRARFKMTCPCYQIWRREKNETEVFLTACLFSDKYIPITENACWHIECILQVVLCYVCCRALEYDVKIIACIIVKQNSLKLSIPKILLSSKFNNEIAHKKLG